MIHLQSKGNRNKNKQMRPNQIYKSLYSKETINKMIRLTSEWETIIASEATDKTLISKIYKQLMQLNVKSHFNLKKKK